VRVGVGPATGQGFQTVLTNEVRALLVKTHTFFTSLAKSCVTPRGT
jgi:hypothetical protein